MFTYKLTQEDKVKLKEYEEELSTTFKDNSDDENRRGAFSLWLRWKCLTDLFFLNAEVLGLREAKDKKTGRPILDEKLHRPMCEFLQNDEDMLMLYPRAHMKSWFLKTAIVQAVLRNPNGRYALWTKTTSLARKELKAIKAILMNPLLMETFPDIIPPVKQWVKNTVDVLEMRRPLQDYKPQEGQVEVWGVDSVVVGHHYDVHYYDDVLDERTITTSEQMEKLETWWQHVQAIKELHAPEKMIGTRYHYHDLYGRVIEEGFFDRVVTRKAIENGKPLYSRFTLKDLNKLKKRMGDYVFSCNPGEAPVLMADFTFKRLDQVNVGDEVIGFEDVEGYGKRIVNTKVVAKGNRISETQTVNLSNGDIIRCTPDHRWWTGRNIIAKGIESHKPYLPVVVGRKMMKMVSLPKSGNENEWGWLGGMIDGEGACKYGSIAIHQSEEHNPEVCKKLRTTLKLLGIDHGDFEDGLYIKGGRDVKIQILNKALPAKAEQIRGTIWSNTGRSVIDKPKVVSITPYGKEMVYSLQTGTGNYIVWGYGSSNCQYMNDPVAMQDRIFVPPYPIYKQLPAKVEYYVTVDPATGKKYSNKTGICVAAIEPRKQDVCYFVEAYRINEPPDVVAGEIVRKIVQYNPQKVGIEYGLQEGLKPLIEYKLQKSQAETRPVFVSIPTNIKNMSKPQKISRMLGAMVRENRVLFREHMQELFHQMDFLNPNTDSNEDDIVDAANMMMMVVPAFEASRWWLSDAHYDYGFTMEGYMKKLRQKERKWGSTMVC